MRKGLSICALAALAACTTAEPDPPAAPEPPMAAAPGCPVIDSRNWHAWVDAMPGPGAQRTLNISGEVDLPTPGYTVSLHAGPMDRMMPPGQRFELELAAPDGMVAQVVTTTPVKYREPTPHARYRSVTILCGGKPLATMPDVMIAE